MSTGEQNGLNYPCEDPLLTDPVSQEPESLVDDAALRRVGKRAAVIDDEVARLRFVRRSIAAHEAAAKRRARRSQAVREASRRRFYLSIRILFIAMLSAVAVVPQAPHRLPLGNLPLAVPRQIAPEVSGPRVSVVARQASVEIYSNGLRVDNEFLTTTRARSFHPFDRKRWRASATESQPAGIVFHTTESRMAPFEPNQNSRLQRNERNLLSYIAQHHFYHFLIDRFGRVFRVVAETDYANHAGQSIWADEKDIYWGLNQSFLGVALEAQTETQTGDSSDIATRAQIDAARVLTEMLRAKYHIAAINCVTHAQVSVNPQTMRLGYHTDWATNFPFREVGLLDGYDTPIAALTLFGFDYDTAFLHANGRRVWQGLVTAQEQLVRDAAAHGTTINLYQRTLHQRFNAWKSEQDSVAQEDAAADRP
ncbi:MAG TPA: peptidoglycan recognition family protein [Bryobacteraceae bacterium]|nr:peptidoglycan recognition family protein [Bryobacteraceae bacterium]